MSVETTFVAELLATQFGAIGNGNFDNEDAFTELAAAVNAVPNTTGVPVLVKFPSGKDRGVYSFSGEPLVFTRPVILMGDGGAYLEYDGDGKMVKFGPDGLDDFNYFLHAQYGVIGLKFTGGATAEHGLYFNDHVTAPRVSHARFDSFGNADAYAIFCQSDNWDTRVTHTDFYVPSNATSRRRNFLRMRGYSESGVQDYGNSLLTFIGGQVKNHGGGGVGIWANGAASVITGGKLEGSDPNVRLGAWANRAKVVNNYFETISTTGADACIQFGDPSDGDLPNADLTGVVIKENYANLHNSDIGITASLVGSTHNAGLIEATVAENNVFGIASSRELIKLVNKAGQVRNRAYGNRGMSKIHTTGGSISSWQGEQGDAPTFRNYVDSSLFLNIQAGSSADQSVGVNLLGWDGALKGQHYYSPGANRIYTQIGSKVASLDNAGNWRCDGQLIPTDSVVVKQKAGVPTDADLVAVNNGAAVLDTANNRIYFRVGGTWKYAALT